VIGALVFLLFRSLKNRVLIRVRKLRQPKYLISALAGLAYLCFVLMNQVHLDRSHIPNRSSIADPAILSLVETGFAVMILAVVVFQWFSSSARNVLFDEAEIQFLFPAPLSRLALLHYRIVKAQPGILFGTAVTTFILSWQSLFAHSIYLFAALWILYSFLHLYRIGVVLNKRRLEKHGRDLGRFRAALVGAAVILLAAVAAWWHHVFSSFPRLNEMSLHELLEFSEKIAQFDPLRYSLMPFRAFVSPAFAPALPDFALSLIPAPLMLFLAYEWARFSSEDFREAALGITTSAAVPLQTTSDRKKAGPVRRSGRTLFRLSPQGPSWVAIYWKNLSLAGGLNSRRTLPALAAITIICILMAGASGKQMSMIFGAAALGLAVFITILGPIVFREDLRADLKNTDLLKTYPMSGRSIVIGEVLTPATVLAVIEWALVLATVTLLPGFEKTPWKISDRIAVGIGAALLFPCISLIGILMQNAAALILPGWVQIEREQQRGIEAMGQRLISSAATVLFLMIAAIPAALVFGVVFFVGYGVMGLATIPLASMLACVALLLEAAAGVLWLGGLFDRFDPSKELS
jgi:ABC-2 type transport system permease protein